MHLKELHIYPIKSARGISLKTAQLDARGLELDRHWMLVDDDGNFLTQRKIPRMALIRVEVRENHLAVRTGGLSELMIPRHHESGMSRRVQVFDDAVDAIDDGDDAARWFTSMMGRSCRLVHMPGDAHRIANPRYARQESLVSFVDAFPLLLLSQASLDELNTRLAEPVTMDRFRPNLVIDGCAPYEEDTWERIQIGKTSFHVAKPCARCAVPGVNQGTGERGVEPLRTLESYRTRDGKVYFGQNLIHEGNGLLSVGDSAFALSLKPV
jgi:uncharacterized protein YcbX